MRESAEEDFGLFIPLSDMLGLSHERSCPSLNVVQTLASKSVTRYYAFLKSLFIYFCLLCLLSEKLSS